MPTGRPTEAVKNLGLELKLLRVRAQLSQQELVEKSNGELRLGTVIAIENGKYNAGISSVLSYLNILGYDFRFDQRPANPTA